MKYLVTGATGYIGSHLIRRLSEEGFETRAFVRPTSNTTRLIHLKDNEICYGDLRDKASCEKAVRGIQVVFHAGALVSDWGDYQRFFEVNCLGTRNILKSSIKAGVQKFIHISTVDVLDLRARRVIKEDLPYDRKAREYSRSKIDAEREVRASAHRIPAVIIRPPAVYGPGDPQCTTRALRMARKNLLFLVSGGKGIFPHVYIDNLIDGLFLVAQEERAVGEIFHISDGVNSTAREFFNHFNRIAGRGDIHLSFPYPIVWWATLFMETFARLTGRPPFISWTALRFLTLKCRFNISKAQRLLAYNPSVSLEEGMRRVSRWWESIN